MKKPSDEIYLQLYGEPYDGFTDVTWCEEQINDDDIVYVRKDIFDAMRLVLEDVYGAIASLPVDALGDGIWTEVNGDPYKYPIRNELLHNIAKVLKGNKP